MSDTLIEKGGSCRKIAIPRNMVCHGGEELSAKHSGP